MATYIRHATPLDQESSSKCAKHRSRHGELLHLHLHVFGGHQGQGESKQKVIASMTLSNDSWIFLSFSALMIFEILWMIHVYTVSGDDCWFWAGQQKHLFCLFYLLSFLSSNNVVIPIWIMIILRSEHVLCSLRRRASKVCACTLQQRALAPKLYSFISLQQIVDTVKLLACFERCSDRWHTLTISGRMR
jgi:hypothetical protein